MVNTSIRPDIQALRGLAVLAVLTFHAGLPVKSGFLGVDAFFVISGFVIAKQVMESQKLGKFTTKEFFKRRVLRLYPNLALMVSVFLALSVCLVSPFSQGKLASLTGLAAIFGVSNILISTKSGNYFDSPAEENIFLHTWSLSAEWQIYIFFFLLAKVIFSKGLKSHHLTILLSASGLISFGLAIYSASNNVIGPMNQLLGFYSPVSRFWEFAIGAILAQSIQTKGSLSSKRSAVPVAGLILLLFSFFTIPENAKFPNLYSTIPVVATALILTSPTNSGISFKILNSSKIVWLGNHSYSIYLWHWPMAALSNLNFPTLPGITLYATAASIPIAVYFEKLAKIATNRIRKLQDQTPNWAWIKRTSLVFTPAILAIYLLSPLSGIFIPSTMSSKYAVNAQEHAGASRGCHVSSVQNERVDLSKCLWNSGAKGNPIYLLGDSNADQFSEGLIASAQKIGSPLTIYTGSSCPFTQDFEVVPPKTKDKYLPTTMAEGEFSHCWSYVNAALNFVLSNEAGTIFIAGLDQWFWDANFGLRQKPSTLTYVQEEKQKILKVSLSKITSKLISRGHRVILIPTLPTWRNPEPIWSLSTCTLLVHTVYGNCSRSASLTYLDSFMSMTRQTIIEVANTTGSETLDLRKFFCEGLQTCATEKNGRSLYRDSTHINTYASKALEPYFTQMLLKADK